VVPDQHAAFGITRAMREKREKAWKDLGLGELMSRGPGQASGGQGGSSGGGVNGGQGGSGRGGNSSRGGAASRLPR
jgi:hypothetical protein